MVRVLSLFAISLLFCSGCATTRFYKAPNENPESLATITGSSGRDSLYEWNQTTVKSINGELIDYPFFSIESDCDYQIKVDAGKNQFACLSIFNTGFLEGPYIATTFLKASLKKGKNYKLFTKARVDVITFWIEDVDSKEIVSEVVETPYTEMQQEIYITII